MNCNVECKSVFHLDPLGGRLYSSLPHPTPLAEKQKRLLGAVYVNSMEQIRQKLI